MCQGNIRLSSWTKNCQEIQDCLLWGTGRSDIAIVIVLVGLLLYQSEVRPQRSTGRRICACSKAEVEYYNIGEISWFPNLEFLELVLEDSCMIKVINESLNA